MPRHYLSSPLFIALLSTASVSAQTSEELRQKDGAVVEGSYLVRPGITASVTTTDYGRVCRIEVAPVRNSHSSEGAAEVMAAEVVEQVVEKLVPSANRGKSLGEFYGAFGRNGVYLSEYENVSILRRTLGTQQSIVSVSIRWKHASCQSERLNAPPSTALHPSPRATRFCLLQFSARAG